MMPEVPGEKAISISDFGQDEGTTTSADPRGVPVSRPLGIRSRANFGRGSSASAAV
jgi:hypothetical protein